MAPQMAAADPICRLDKMTAAGAGGAPTAVSPPQENGNGAKGVPRKGYSAVIAESVMQCINLGQFVAILCGPSMAFECTAKQLEIGS